MKIQIRYHIIAVIIAAISFTGCFTYEDITYEGIEDVKMSKDKGEYQVKVFVKINNPNNYNVVLKKGTFDITLGNKSVGEIVLDEKVKIKKRSNATHEVILTTSLQELGQGAIGTMMSIFSGGNIELGVKGTAKVRAMIIVKKFDVDFTKNVNLKDFNLKDLMNF